LHHLIPVACHLSENDQGSIAAGRHGAQNCQFCQPDPKFPPLAPHHAFQAENGLACKEKGRGNRRALRMKKLCPGVVCDPGQLVTGAF